MILKLADLNIKIVNKYEYIADMCVGYTTAENDFTFDVTVTDSEISAENSGGFAADYLESLAVYRKIAEHLPLYDGFLMHGAVIEAENCGIAFLAESGVGKSTHVALWQQFLRDKIKVINGDKPIVRIIGGTAYAYGTPWAGKERMHTNAKTVLQKICFIERAVKNECVHLEKSEILTRLIPQIYIPKNDSATKIFSLIDTLIMQSEFYLIRCNTDISAAETAYGTVMSG